LRSARSICPSIAPVCGLSVRLSSSAAGTSSPIRRDVRAARLRADALGTYPRSTTIRCTRSIVSGDTRARLPLTTFDTVIMLTPASSAMSLRVTRPNRTPSIDCH
jgi:hypothetical protein